MAPACVTLKLLPAICALAERLDVLLFDVQLTVTAVGPGPEPLAGETESHEPLPNAVQLPPWQPDGALVTVTLCEPDADPGVADAGVIV